MEIRPLTPELWPALEDLFGTHGASNGCWCMYWRIGTAYRKRPRELNKHAFKRIVTRGPPPGLLAFDGDKAIGWCQITPRSDLHHLDKDPSEPVWSISCFYVRRGYRNQGVTSALIRAAVRAAKQAGAPAVEAYPRNKHTPGAYTGVASTFARAGFKPVDDKIMRRRFRKAEKPRAR